LTEGVSHCCYWACANPSPEQLFKCKGCGVVKYCCREHQEQDWKWEHKVECTRSVPQYILDEMQSDKERYLRGDYLKIEHGDS
jgi:hypothetical protein